MKGLVCSILILTSVIANAEVYRWTDSDGKTHFGDKKATASAENITEKIAKTNVDTSTSEHQKLESVFRKENAADREYQQQQAQPDPALIKRCEDAKSYLAKISGRVQFFDDNGKPINVSEVERRTRAEEMRNIIKENCPQQ